MSPRIHAKPAGALPALSALLLAAGAQAGPVLLIGDAADDHAGQNVYATLTSEVLANVSNGQGGILALGVEVGSEASDWLLGLSALLTPPQPVAFASGDTIAAIGFSGYAIIYVPSSAGLVDGGVTQAENDLLELRASDLADFLDAGGGLIALSQGELSNAWAFLGDFAEVSALAASGGLCGGKELFDDVSPTESGQLFGITATNIDGCCWGNVFTSFLETLTPLAAANEPGCPDFDGEAAILVGDVEIPDINFDPPTVTPAAGEPDIEAVGNLDNDPDGTIDVIAVIPNQDPKAIGAVQPFENLGTDGDGLWLGLDPKDVIDVGVNPSGVTVGLFNGDALLDMAVPNLNDDTVSILFNNGGFSFTEVATIAVGSQPSAITAGDFTEDGAVDLAVGLFGDQSIVILENDGSGNFTPLAGSEGPGFLGLGPATLFSDDFDNNKCPDLTGSGDEGGGIAGTGGGLVFVAFGQGGGVFGEPVFFEVGGNPEDIAVGDFDNNGFKDIATSNAADDTISVLLNNGGAAAGGIGFDPQLVLAVGDNPVSVEAADFNADGDVDLAVVADTLSIGPAVQVLANRLDGGSVLSFGNPIAFSVDADPNFVVSSDMNADTLPDLITVNQEENEGEGSVSVLLLQPPTTSEDCPGDLNGDGVVNVVDLLELLFSWGACPTGGECPADLNGDGVIDVLDLLELLMLWGPCPADGCPWDLNGDGTVDGLDIAELLANLGDCKDPDNCPWDLDGDGTVGLLDLWVLILHLGDCEG